jgi:HEPN domain-containing protein
MAVRTVFSDVRSEYNDWLSINNEILIKIFTWAQLIDPDSISSLSKQGLQKWKYKISKIPRGKLLTLNRAQQSLISKWSDAINHGDYLIQHTIRNLPNEAVLKEIQQLESVGQNQDLNKLLLETHKLHYLKFYDAAVNSCKNTTEILLKYKLKQKSIKFDEKWDISKLFKKLSPKIKKSPQFKHIKASIEIIIKTTKNKYTLKNPRFVTKDESKNAWQSLKLLTEELFR